MLVSYLCDPYASAEMILAFAGEKFSWISHFYGVDGIGQKIWATVPLQT
jgi:hypothetical protein